MTTAHRWFVALFSCLGFVQACSNQNARPSAAVLVTADGSTVVPTDERNRTSLRTDQEMILDSVIDDLLTNPLLAHARSWYGSTGEKTIGLSRPPGATRWPPHYAPSVAGYRFEFLDPDRAIDRDQNRQLGVVIHRFQFPPPKVYPPDDLYFNAPIAVGLFNIGGSKNGAANGGCCVLYELKRTDGGWSIEYAGSGSQ
jgi:hypothetical protein